MQAGIAGRKAPRLRLVQGYNTGKRVFGHHGSSHGEPEPERRTIMERTTDRIIQSRLAIAEFCRRNGIARLDLFGSVLRDDFGPDSDIDVLVAFHPGVRVGFIALSRMQRELSDLLGRQVDLVPRDGLKPRIRDVILSGTRVLYAA